MAIGCAPGTASAATVLDSRPAKVTPCPLPAPGEPTLVPEGEPLFCDDGRSAEPTGGKGGRAHPPAGGRAHTNGRARGPRRGSTRRPPEVDDDAIGRDPFKSLGGNSPFCESGHLPAKAMRNCKSSGS